MMYDMRRRKLEPTLWPSQGIFNLLGMVWEELAFNDAVSYTQWEKWIAAQLNIMAVIGCVPLSPESPSQCLNQLSNLTSSFNTRRTLDWCKIHPSSQARFIQHVTTRNTASTALIISTMSSALPKLKMRNVAEILVRLSCQATIK